MLKELFLGGIILNFTLVSAATPSFCQKYFGWFYAKNKITDQYHHKYVAVSLNKKFEDKIYQNRSYLDRFLDCCARIKKKR
jgi:hypothetical protein